MEEKVELDDYASPPYEESKTTTPPPAFSCSKEPPRPSLHTQLMETRTRRIHSLLTAYIEPLLYSGFLDGIYKRAFLVVPADTLTQQPHLEAKDIVAGPPNASNVSVIRLDGDENRSAFWQQPAVLQELASSLRARLAASGHRVEPDPAMPGFATTETAPGAARRSPTMMDESQRQRQQSSPSWLAKKFGTPGPTHDPTATIKYKLGWRAEDEELPRRELALDEVRVLVKARDVSFRVETEMGLLDSVTARVLWLELHVGS